MSRQAESTGGPPQTAAPGELFGHPRAMWILAATELWDRISFHGMQALLVLYMAGELLRPGHVEHILGFEGFRRAIEAVTGPLSVQALATQVFGLYVGLAYFTPILGGWLGDRVLGRTASVTLGALMMTAGHFCMALDETFLPALALLILGAGAFRGNLSPQLGELYDRGDRRRDTAFQIYGAMVNLGGFISPLATGALGQTFGWHAGFAFAGFGMLIGLIVYLAGGRWIGLAPSPAPAASGRPRQPLRGPERRLIVRLLAMIPVSALFWVAQSQIWNTYNLWARDHVQMRVGSFVAPVPWLQSLDGLAPFILLPAVLWLWRWQGRHGGEPDEIAKVAVGCFIFAAATAWLAAAPLVLDAEGRTPLLWAVAFHLASNAGWLFYSPTMTALFSRLAPAPVNATMMGASALSVFVGSLVSGRLGGLYETLPASQFWLLHALLVGLGGGLALLLGPGLMRAAAEAGPEAPLAAGP